MQTKDKGLLYKSQLRPLTHPYTEHENFPPKGENEKLDHGRSSQTRTTCQRRPNTWSERPWFHRMRHMWWVPGHPCQQHAAQMSSPATPFQREAESRGASSEFPYSADSREMGFLIQNTVMRCLYLTCLPCVSLNTKIWPCRSVGTWLTAQPLHNLSALQCIQNRISLHEDSVNKGIWQGRKLTFIFKDTLTFWQASVSQKDNHVITFL